MRSTCGFAAGGKDEPATLSKLGKRVSANRFAYLGCRTARVRSCSVQDLSPSDSDLSQLGRRRGSHSGFREGASRRSDRRPDRAKPQVTRVIGVVDPYRQPPAQSDHPLRGLDPDHAFPRGPRLLRAQARPRQDDQGGPPVSQAEDLRPDLRDPPSLGLDIGARVAGLRPSLLQRRLDGQGGRPRRR